MARNLICATSKDVGLAAWAKRREKPQDGTITKMVDFTKQGFNVKPIPNLFQPLIRCIYDIGDGLGG